MQIRLTRAVKALLIACVAAFLVQQISDQFLGGNLLSWFGLVPSQVVFGGRIWQIVTYSFLHGDVMHLVLNMMMLVFIGGELESAWGTPRFLRFYFFCVVCGGLAYLFLQTLVWKGTAPMVGASGGIYGLLMAYGILFGERVLLFMMLFPMKAKHFVWILAAIELLSTVFAGHAGGGLGSVAHLGGMAGGFAYLYGRAYWKVSQKRQLDKQGQARKDHIRKGRSHLKVVGGTEQAKDSESDTDSKTWH